MTSAIHPGRTSASDCRILIVDSNPADVALVKEAFRQAQLAPELHVVGDGDHALAFLRREGRFTRAPRPDFILLEQHLPCISGTDVLATLKSDPNLHDIPVVVCSAFQSGHEVEEAYDLRASAAVDKAAGLDQFFAVIRSLYSKWCEEAAYPPEPDTRADAGA